MNALSVGVLVVLRLGLEFGSRLGLKLRHVIECAIFVGVLVALCVLISVGSRGYLRLQYAKKG